MKKNILNIIVICTIFLSAVGCTSASAEPNYTDTIYNTSDSVENLQQDGEELFYHNGIKAEKSEIIELDKDGADIFNVCFAVPSGSGIEERKNVDENGESNWIKLSADSMWGDYHVESAESAYVESYDEKRVISQVVNFDSSITISGTLEFAGLSEGDTGFLILRPDEDTIKQLPSLTPLNGRVPRMPALVETDDKYMRSEIQNFIIDHNDPNNQILVDLVNQSEDGSVKITVKADSFSLQWTEYGLPMDGSTWGRLYNITVVD